MRKIFLLLSLLPLYLAAELISLNDTQIYVHTMGRGAPIVVLHGGPGLDQGYMRPQLDGLAIRNKLIYYDQRCSGYSCGDPTKEPITMAQYVEDLEALRQKLGIQKMILLGHSFGGHLAMRYAIQYPDHVAALILMSTLPASTEGVNATAASYKEHLKQNEEILTRIRDSQPFRNNNPSTMEAYYMMIFSTQVYTPENTRRINLNFTEESAANVNRVADAMGKDLQRESFDLHPQLAQIKAPTLIIHGREDFVPSAEVRKIEHAIPNARYVEMTETGHFPHVERTDETLETITEFLQGLQLTGAGR